MGLGNILILAQVTVYLLVFLLSFFIFVPLTVNLSQFNGHCLLYATGTWNSSTGESWLTKVQWGNPSSCDFPVFMGIVALPASFFYILWMSIYLFKDTEPSWLAAFLGLVVASVYNVMTFAAALLTTLGFKAWCNTLTQSLQSDISACEFGDFIKFAAEKDINTKDFYIEFGMAQFGLWTSWICWMILTGFASFKLYQYHRQEDFFTSMSRERQRLLQRVGNRPQYI